MSKFVNDETPVRDVITSQMVDQNLDAQSTASSEISESLCDLILGKTRPRPIKPNIPPNSQDLLSSFVVVSSIKDIIEKPETNDNISKEDSYHTDNASFVVVNPSKDLIGNPISNENISKELSYHTPEESNRNLSQELSFHSARGSSINRVGDPRDLQIPTSMKAAEDKRYKTIETQTVAIQTATTGTDSDLDCKCTWSEQYKCNCQECTCRNYRYARNRNREIISEEITTDPSDFRTRKRDIISEETTTDPNFDSYTDSSSPAEEKGRDHFRCTCNCRGGYDYDSPSASEPLTDSDDFDDFLDLPYQNNEEYLKVLRELEKKLIARNKERVRKTMMEFERRSRMNQNLEKPISDYSDDAASMLRKLSGKKSKKKKPECCTCCKCGRKRVNSDIMQNEKRWDEMKIAQTAAEAPEVDKLPPSHRIERSLHKSHWRLDPRSGEWLKISCCQQTDFARPPHGDYSDDYKTSSGHGHRKECPCRKKREKY